MANYVTLMDMAEVTGTYQSLIDTAITTPEGKVLHSDFIGGFTSKERYKTEIDKIIQGLWKEQYSYYKSYAAQKLLLTDMVEDKILKPALLEKISNIKMDIEAAEGPIQFFSTLDDRTRKIQFEEFWDAAMRAKQFGRALEGIVQASIITAEEAKRAADIARNSITQEQVAELQQKAGSDDLYFSQLYQNIYMSNLASEYEKAIGEMGPEILSDVKRQIESSNQWLEENKPNPVLEMAGGAVDMIGDEIDKIKRKADEIKKGFFTVGTGMKIGLGIAAALGIGFMFFFKRR